MNKNKKQKKNFLKEFSLSKKIDNFFEVPLCTFPQSLKNVKRTPEHVTLIIKRSNVRKTKQMHNANIQVFTAAGNPVVQPVVIDNFDVVYATISSLKDDIVAVNKDF